MQDNQQYGNDSINGLGTPPVLQDSSTLSTDYPTLQPTTPVTSQDQSFNLNSSDDSVNNVAIPNNISRTPLNSVSEPSLKSDPITLGDDGDDLLNIKKQALQQLQPLVDRLDLDPEEKFNTTMMMIQASDDQTLINKAFKAAQQITDEKDKAQALLDIVNEINYFTHNEEIK